MHFDAPSRFRKQACYKRLDDFNSEKTINKYFNKKNRGLVN